MKCKMFTANNPARLADEFNNWVCDTIDIQKLLTGSKNSLVYLGVFYNGEEEVKDEAPEETETAEVEEVLDDKVEIDPDEEDFSVQADAGVVVKRGPGRPRKDSK